MPSNLEEPHNINEDPFVISDDEPEDEGDPKEIVPNEEITVESGELEDDVEAEEERTRNQLATPDPDDPRMVESEALVAQLDGRTSDLGVRFW